MGVLSAFIDIISEVDLAVGPFLGESYYMRIEEGRVVLGPLTSEAIREFKDKVRQRKEIMRRLWRILDSLGEGKVLEKIGDLEKDVENEVGEE